MSREQRASLRTNKEKGEEGEVEEEESEEEEEEDEELGDEEEDVESLDDIDEGNGDKEEPVKGVFHKRYKNIMILVSIFTKGNKPPFYFLFFY